jgi:TRAP-type C4-dicarboxylate transport system permease small subunit
MWLTVGGAITTAVMMVITTAEVFARKVLRTSLEGSYEYVSLLFPGVVFLGLAYAQSRNEHIQLGIFDGWIPARLRRPIQGVVLGLSLALFAVITWSSAMAAVWAWQMGDTILGALPVLTWPSRLFVPVGAGFLCLRLAVQLWQLVNGREVFEPRNV